MIQQIGFKNFRRFEEFPTMDLGPINIFVGRNNAGKSTVMKALALIKGNLRTTSQGPTDADSNKYVRPMFTFNVDDLSELHIDSFDRALYNKAKRKEITLSTTIDGQFITIVLDGQNIEENNSHVSVPYNSVELDNDFLHLIFDFQTRHLFLETKGRTVPRDSEIIEEYEEELNACNSALHSVRQHLWEINEYIHGNNSMEHPTSAEIQEFISKREDLKRQERTLQNEVKHSHMKLQSLTKMDKAVSITIDEFPELFHSREGNIFQLIFTNIFRYATNIPIKFDKRTNEYLKYIETKKNIESIDEVLISAEDLFCSDSVLMFNLEYIHAHAASQKVIYLKDDKEDTLSRILSQFRKNKIVKETPAWDFVKKWMDKDHFDIGEDFEIKEIEGAGYTLKIIEDGLKVNLADKGTGSIQLMTLLLSLATYVHRVTTNHEEITVLVEEPEQNLHPMLQSLLADMFLDFYKETKCQLIIETHSEYLIRKTQLLVARENYQNEDKMNKENPFKVFYFPSENDMQPYSMQYQIDGKFANDFKKGFFDVAEDLAFEIL